MKALFLNVIFTLFLGSCFPKNNILKEDLIGDKWFVNKIVNYETNEKLPIGAFECSFLEFQSPDSCRYFNSLATYSGTWELSSANLTINLGKDSLDFQILKYKDDELILRLKDLTFYTAFKSWIGCK